MERNELLKRIPKVDELLQEPQIAALRETLAPALVTDLVRARLDALRHDILAAACTEIPPREVLCQQICGEAQDAAKPSLRPVINATGVVLHTNLGRACLSRRAADAVYAAARGYSTLEYDLNAGKRGSRHSHVEKILCKVTGAEAAMAVNNNAAAVLLILSALGKGGEVITSRGELVEIGGSFRIPEIMEQCGCRLREVGATNKTHIYDYERAIGPETCALLKVHTSNFKIMGFTESVSLEDLVQLGEKYDLPVIEDLGSGSLCDLERYGLHGEPTVMDSVRAGVDVISFSGDKLLGGPQAGIILGRKGFIDLLKKHPLARAVRLDKMTLAALEATLSSYLDLPRAEQEIPTLAMLAVKPEQLQAKAEALLQKILACGPVNAAVVPEQDQVGGGSVPTQMLDTYAVAILPTACSVDGLEERLRLGGETPIIGRIVRDRYLLDVRTLWEEQFDYIANRVAEESL